MTYNGYTISTFQSMYKAEKQGTMSTIQNLYKAERKVFEHCSFKLRILKQIFFEFQRLNLNCEM